MAADKNIIFTGYVANDKISGYFKATDCMILKPNQCQYLFKYGK